MMALVAELILLLLWLRTLSWAVLGVRFHMRALRGLPTLATETGIAVVIPAFNEEDQIAATISAIRGSDVTPTQVIVVDDGSTDRTAEIARADLGRVPNASMIQATRNSGKALALNVGFAAVHSTLVASIDADTRLDSGALRAAAARLLGTGADAVAFDLQVDPNGSFLSRVQAQEYLASLNFERAGQAAAGAISVLPGAATLFRRDSIGNAPFRARTLTEDADITLELMLSGCNADLEMTATARTAAPADIGTLIRQRVRWATGHMQCVLYHARSGSSRLRGYLVYLNFAVGAFSPLLATLGMSCLVALGPGPILGFGWMEAAGCTALVVYAQRLFALAVRQSSAGPLLFVVEPIVSGAVSTFSSYLALLRLLISLGEGSSQRPENIREQNPTRLAIRGYGDDRPRLFFEGAKLWWRR